MTLIEANEILDKSPIGDAPSRLNKGMTQRQAVEVVRKGINAGRSVLERDGINLLPIFEKRVHQVSQDRKRPKL